MLSLYLQLDSGASCWIDGQAVRQASAQSFSAARDVGSLILQLPEGNCPEFTTNRHVFNKMILETTFRFAFYN
jgi:hypothetical protein